DPSFLPAELIDSFESPDPVWRLIQSDGRARIAHQIRDFRVAHSGQSSEAVRISTQGGSYAYLSYDINPAILIDELAVSLWLRADHSGPQMALRVVLPYSRDPRTGRCITVLLFGS